MNSLQPASPSGSKGDPTLNPVLPSTTTKIQTSISQITSANLTVNSASEATNRVESNPMDIVRGILPQKKLAAFEEMLSSIPPFYSLSLIDLWMINTWLNIDELNSLMKSLVSMPQEKRDRLIEVQEKSLRTMIQGIHTSLYHLAAQNLDESLSQNKYFSFYDQNSKLPKSFESFKGILRQSDNFCNLLVTLRPNSEDRSQRSNTAAARLKQQVYAKEKECIPSIFQKISDLTTHCELMEMLSSNSAFKTLCLDYTVADFLPPERHRNLSDQQDSKYLAAFLHIFSYNGGLFDSIRTKTLPTFLESITPNLDNISQNQRSSPKKILEFEKAILQTINKKIYELELFYAEGLEAVAKNDLDFFERNKSAELINPLKIENPDAAFFEINIKLSIFEIQSLKESLKTALNIFETSVVEKTYPNRFSYNFIYKATFSQKIDLLVNILNGTQAFNNKLDPNPSLSLPSMPSFSSLDDLNSRITTLKEKGLLEVLSTLKEIIDRPTFDYFAWEHNMQRLQSLREDIDSLLEKVEEVFQDLEQQLVHIFDSSSSQQIRENQDTLKQLFADMLKPLDDFQNALALVFDTTYDEIARDSLVSNPRLVNKKPSQKKHLILDIDSLVESSLEKKSVKESNAAISIAEKSTPAELSPKGKPSFTINKNLPSSSRKAEATQHADEESSSLAATITRDTPILEIVKIATEIAGPAHWGKGDHLVFPAAPIVGNVSIPMRVGGHKKQLGLGLISKIRWQLGVIEEGKRSTKSSKSSTSNNILSD